MENQSLAEMPPELFDLLSSLVIEYCNKNRFQFKQNLSKIKISLYPQILQNFIAYLNFITDLTAALDKVNTQTRFADALLSVLETKEFQNHPFSREMIRYLHEHREHLNSTYFILTHKMTFEYLLTQFLRKEYRIYFENIVDFVSRLFENPGDQYRFFVDYYQEIPELLNPIPPDTKIFIFVTPLKDFLIYMIERSASLLQDSRKSIKEFLTGFYCRNMIFMEDLETFPDTLISSTGMTTLELSEQLKKVEYLLQLNPVKRSENFDFFGIPLEITRQSGQEKTWFTYRVRKGSDG